MIMTPGPTTINEEVRKEMANPITNPDLDLSFFDFYKETSESLARLLHTKNEVLILSGEGILGLEAACASLIEPGDKVLCIDNGFLEEDLEILLICMVENVNTFLLIIESLWIF